MVLDTVRALGSVRIRVSALYSRRGLCLVSLFGVAICNLVATCLYGLHGGAYGGAYFAVVLAWRKGVASAQRSGLTSEEVRGRGRGVRETRTSAYLRSFRNAFGFSHSTSTTR